VGIAPYLYHKFSVGRRAAADLWWVQKGATVKVEWRTADWWPATAMEVFDYPDARTVYIAYGCGWKKYDEWVGDAARVRHRRARSISSSKTSSAF